MSLRKDDLKKPLKVQFVGEEGIDEGGVQKEFFQRSCRRSSTSATACSMTRTLRWFNCSSLENELEFELIGVLSGSPTVILTCGSPTS